MGMSRQTRKRGAREKVARETVKVRHSLPETGTTTSGLMSEVGFIDDAQLRVNAFHERHRSLPFLMCSPGIALAMMRVIGRISGKSPCRPVDASYRASWWI